MEKKPTNTTDQPAASDLAAWRARLAASMQAWAILACMNLRPPGGSWAASDARLNLLPEGTSAS